jgi:hypothetical protein
VFISSFVYIGMAEISRLKLLMEKNHTLASYNKKATNRWSSCNKENKPSQTLCSNMKFYNLFTVDKTSPERNLNDNNLIRRVSVLTTALFHL